MATTPVPSTMNGKGAREPAPPPASQAAPPAPTADSDAATALIVDQSAATTALLTMVLEHGGIRTRRARSADEALSALREEVPDIIVAAARLPGRSGIELCRAVRSRRATSLIPLLLLNPEPRSGERVAAYQAGADDVLAVPFDPNELLLRVRHLVHRFRHQNLLNPLTKLPGSAVLREVFDARRAEGTPWALVYLDLDHFKEFNDYYGFAHGDQVIAFLGRLLQESVAELGAEDDVVCHVGGDDFVVVITPDRAEPLCQHVIARFDEGVRGFYRPEDLERGYIEVASRRGEVQRFPLLSLSIGIVSSDTAGAATFLEVDQVSAEVKARAKRLPGSAYYRNQRRFGRTS